MHNLSQTYKVSCVYEYRDGRVGRENWEPGESIRDSDQDDGGKRREKEGICKNGLNSKEGFLLHNLQAANGSQEKATAERAAEKGIFSFCEEAGGVGELIHSGTMPSEGPRKDWERSQ